MDKIVTLEEAKDIIADGYDYIWDNAKAYGRNAKIYNHWTAGGYSTLFPDYHFCITGDGKIHQTADIFSPVSSTYMRNSGSLAISLCAAYNATCTLEGDYDLGPCPPTESQIECLSMLNAVAATVLGIEPTIDGIMTHGEAADNEDDIAPHEPYAVWSDPQPSDGITRWDLAVLQSGDEWRSGGDTIRGNTIWYQNHLDILK